MDAPLARTALRLPAAALLLAALCAAPAAAAEAPLPYDLAALGDAAPGLAAPAPRGFVQSSEEIDDDILLPAADDREQPKHPPAETLPSETLEPVPPAPQDGRKWSRDYLALAAGVVTAPSYNGSDERVILPGFYLRGRLSGFSFSTRGTNLQVDLIRQRRGQRVDWKFGPLINLRGDRTGRIKDPQVEALGEKKLAVELGVSAGVTYSGLVTSKYDQIGFRIVALKDISGRHGSWVASPTIEYGTPISKRAYLGMSASVNIYGKGFGRYYYDIDPIGSAASGLPVYTGAGRKVTMGKFQIGAAGAYSLSGDLRKGFVLIGGVQYGRMTSRYAASPIVAEAGAKDQWIGGAGVAYQF